MGFPAKAGAHELSALACGVYLGMMKQLPAMVRQWFNAAADKRTADEVESFTAKYVTPALWAEESENINSSKTAFDNMTVRVRAILGRCLNGFLGRSQAGKTVFPLRRSPCMLEWSR